MKQALVMYIGDTHIPFEHPDALEFLKAVRRKEGPTRIAHAGDLTDMHALSRFDHDPDGFSSGHELSAALKVLKSWYTAFPKVDICTSNHDERPYRLAYRAGLPSSYLRSYRDFLQSPGGWVWNRQFLIDGVRYEHGEGFTGRNGAINCALGNMASTAIGHIHSFAGIQWAANPRHLVFGFNVGCLIDKDAYAFAYGKAMKNKPILGVGIIERGNPRFIPMQLKSDGRWTGKL